MDFFLAILPIAILVWVMTKRQPWPSHVALPFAAGLVYFIVLVYFRDNPNLVNATVVNGALSALTPISIIWGAILLSQTMRRSGAEHMVSQWLNGVSPNPVAQLMIVGWAFAFMIEGSSGFGTPAAIAAPLLVGLGFEPLRVAILTLVMNSVPVSFGAVGTPMWFGFGQLALSPSEMLSVSWKAALVQGVAALFVPVMALRFVVGWGQIRRNLVYIYLSILSCVVPYILLARFNYEFPALVGGALGLGLSTFLARQQLGLATDAAPQGTTFTPPDHQQVLQAFTPYLLLIVILVVTRLRVLPFRAWLNAESPAWTLDLGSLGQFTASVALVLKLDSIFGTGSSWSYNALFVPALIPFVAVVLLSLPILKINLPMIGEVVADTTRRLKNSAITLVGALIMVQLMMVGGDTAKTMIIGRAFARSVGGAWPFFAPWLGALGGFFAGSATVSNLTFGGIQDSIAQTLGLDRTSILALQSVGAAMGSMVSVNNIIAVGCIIGLVNQEGFILKRISIPLLAYGLAAGLLGLVLCLK